MNERAQSTVQYSLLLLTGVGYYDIIYFPAATWGWELNNKSIARQELTIVSTVRPLLFFIFIFSKGFWVIITAFFYNDCPESYPPGYPGTYQIHQSIGISFWHCCSSPSWPDVASPWVLNSGKSLCRSWAWWVGTTIRHHVCRLAGKVWWEEMLSYVLACYKWQQATDCCCLTGHF